MGWAHVHHDSQGQGLMKPGPKAEHLEGIGLGILDQQRVEAVSYPVDRGLHVAGLTS